MKTCGANGWRERRGQAERERGLATCARAVVSGGGASGASVGGGAETLARASTGGHANLFAGRACGCGVSAPTELPLLCFWAKGLHCCCKPNCLGQFQRLFLFIFSVSGSAFIPIHFINTESRALRFCLFIVAVCESLRESVILWFCNKIL